MMKILVATGNRGKLVEIQSLLEGAPLTLLTPAMLGLALEVEETGATYAENAALKARAFAQASGLLALADDSGLEVDALGGLPGIRSARFSNRAGASDADRRAYLLQRLQGLPRPWTAHFHCTVALAAPTGALRFAEGQCPGEIIPQERGEHGFGYDPIFLLTALGLTMAELSMAQKNQLSHRARAIKAAQPLIMEMLGK
ncbi:MAG TPA: RdgB/HAM1 family non-canonical purine NTP pyrophosphatase [Anaerolineales bacterium]|nr:RdgB/HAM1 family non-canonical purine NTP pyrophosphatase [Anaerolineales bacterium]